MKCHSVLILCCFTLAFLISPAPAWSLSMVAGGNWDYVNGSEVESSLTESYLAGLSQHIDFTQIMSGLYNLRYSYRKEPSTSSQVFGPSVALNFGNDIFSYKFSGTGSFNRKELEEDATSEQSQSVVWSNVIRSSWDKKLWPTLSFTYSESYNDTDKGEGETNSSGNSFGANIQWEYNQLYLYYDFSQTKATNDATLTASKSYSHLGKLDYKRNLGLRGNLVFSQTYTYQGSEFSSQPDAIGTIMVPVVIADIRYGETDIPETGEVVNNGNPPNTVIIDPANERMNIALQVNNEQVDVIYLYTVDDISNFADNVIWDLYSSSDGENWDLEQADIPLAYDSQERRFELTIPSLRKTYLKLVSNTDALLVFETFEITRLEAFRRVSGSSAESSGSTSRSQLTMGYQVSSRMRLGYSFEYTMNETSLGTESNNMRNNASLNWIIGETLSSALSVNDFRNESDGSPGDQSTNYTISLMYAPLPTLRNSLIFSHNRREQGGTVTATNDSYSLQSAASLYDDLDGLFSIIHATSENSAATGKSETITSQLRLTARLSQKLAMNLNNNYTHDLQGGIKNYKTDANVSWRLSEFFFTSFVAGYSWGDAPTAMDYSMRADISFSSRLRGGLGYSFSDSAGMSRHYLNGALDVIISKLLTFNVSGFYSMADISGDKNTNTVTVAATDADIWGTSCSLKFRYNSF